MFTFQELAELPEKERRVALALQEEARKICEELCAENPSMREVYERRLETYKPVVQRGQP